MRREVPKPGPVIPEGDPCHSPEASAMVRVKVCGITNAEDALNAVSLGADALGFVFVPGSPRRITPQAARSIVEQLPPFVVKVGVFADEALEQILRVMAACHLNVAQLHGDEPRELVAALAPVAVKAVRMRDEASLQRLKEYQPAAFLLDAYVPDQLGGTGRTFQWAWAAAAKTCGRPILLSGGLTPENVAEAIRQVRPYGVDVSSGVEAAVGKKDQRRMGEFIARAKACEPAA